MSSVVSFSLQSVLLFVFYSSVTGLVFLQDLATLGFQFIFMNKRIVLVNIDSWSGFSWQLCRSAFLAGAPLKRRAGCRFSVRPGCSSRRPSLEIGRGRE